MDEQQIDALQKKGAEVFQRLMNSSLNAFVWRVMKFNHDGGNVQNQAMLSKEARDKEVEMIQEELDELKLAFDGFYMKKTPEGKVKTEFQSSDQQRQHIADALGDIIYVTTGTGLKFGMDMATVLWEICDSNDTKYTDGVLVKSNGKIQKGPDFREPDLKFVNEPIDFTASIVKAKEQDNESASN